MSIHPTPTQDIVMSHKDSRSQAAAFKEDFLDLCRLFQIFDRNIDRCEDDDVQVDFHLFPLLPPELRLLIWEYALPGPRTLRREWNNDKFQFGLLGSVPKLLHVCTESRYWFLSSLATQELSTNKYQLVHQKPGQGGGVFVNWTRDDVFISRGFNVTDFEIAELQSLRCLTMTWGQRPCWVKHSLSDGVRFIRRFPRLERLSLKVMFVPKYFEEGGPVNRKHEMTGECHELKVIAAMVLTEFQAERDRDPEWRPPRLRVMSSKQ